MFTRLHDITPCHLRLLHHNILFIRRRRRDKQSRAVLQLLLHHGVPSLHLHVYSSHRKRGVSQEIQPALQHLAVPTKSGCSIVASFKSERHEHDAGAHTEAAAAAPAAGSPAAKLQEHDATPSQRSPASAAQPAHLLMCLYISHRRQSGLRSASLRQNVRGFETRGGTHKRDTHLPRL
jgi:hypothetical protein